MKDNKAVTTNFNGQQRTTPADKPHHNDFVDDAQSSHSLAGRPSESTADSRGAAPDGGYGWVIVVAAFAINFIHDGMLLSFGILYVEFLDYFGADKSRTSLIGSVSVATAQSTAVLTGVLINRYGCRPVAIAGSVISTLALATSRLTTSIDALTVMFGVVGFGFGLLLLPSLVAVSTYFKRRRAMATGIAISGTGVGSFVIAPVGSVLLQLYGWKNVMLVLAAITLQGCVFGGLLRQLEVKSRKREELPMIPNSSCPKDEAVDVTKPSLFSRMVRGSGVYLLAKPIFLCMFIGNILTSLGFFVPFYFITDRAIELGVEPTQAAFLLFAVGITNTLGGILMGYLADLKKVSALLLHNATVVCVGVAALLVRFCVVYWSMVVYALVHGLCIATFGTLTPVVLCELLGLETLANSFGMVSLIRGLAGAAGPPLAATVASQFTTSNVYDVSFTIAGLEFLVAGGVFSLIPIFLWRRRRAAETSSPS